MTRLFQVLDLHLQLNAGLWKLYKQQQNLLKIRKGMQF